MKSFNDYEPFCGFDNSFQRRAVSARSMACRERTCGAEDCPTCYPQNFQTTHCTNCRKEIIMLDAYEIDNEYYCASCAEQLGEEIDQ